LITAHLRASFVDDYDGCVSSSWVLPTQIAAVIEQRFEGRSPVRLLDAGCGDKRVQLPVPVYAVGIDTSAEQIARNHHLDEARVGDLETIELEQAYYDLVICWDVIEHLRDPVVALDKMIDAVRSGGLLLLGFPNRNSVKAIVARLVPYRVHLLAFRWLYPNAMIENDRGPFPTVLDATVALDRLLAHTAARGMSVEGLVSYESEMQRKARRKLRLTGRGWAATKAAINTLSAGRVNAEMTDVILVLGKSGRMQERNESSDPVSALPKTT
jgi:SAM-dependent methyltransferase